MHNVFSPSFGCLNPIVKVSESSLTSSIVMFRFVVFQEIPASFGQKVVG